MRFFYLFLFFNYYFFAMVSVIVNCLFSPSLTTELLLSRFAGPHCLPEHREIPLCTCVSSPGCLAVRSVTSVPCVHGSVVGRLHSGVSASADSASWHVGAIVVTWVFSSPVQLWGCLAVEDSGLLCRFPDGPFVCFLLSGHCRLSPSVLTSSFPGSSGLSGVGCALS